MQQKDVALTESRAVSSKDRIIVHPPKPQSAAVDPQSRGEAGERPLRVLIAEDELMIALSLESMIEDFGFQVCGTPASGDDAVKEALETRPDVVLMDINLGRGLDGIEAARQASQAVDARIVFITAYGGPVILNRIQTAVPGAVVVTKPIDSRALWDALKTP